jgi:hypothetical protein
VELSGSGREKIPDGDWIREIRFVIGGLGNFAHALE